MHSPLEIIQSADNRQFKRLLRYAQKKGRRSDGVCLVEGKREIDRALAAGWQLLELAVCAGSPMVAEWDLKDVPILVFAGRLWAKLVYRESTEDFLGIFEKKQFGIQELERLDEEEKRRGKRLPLIVIDGLEKPGNVGAILRSVDATSGGAVLAIGDFDWENPNVIRASTGARFSVFCGCAEADELAKSRLISGRRIVALDPFAADEWRPGKIHDSDVLVFGSEAFGLGNSRTRLATHAMQLPMRGTVDSLNVAQCATVLLYDRMDV